MHAYACSHHDVMLKDVKLEDQTSEIFTNVLAPEMEGEREEGSAGHASPVPAGHASPVPVHKEEQAVGSLEISYGYLNIQFEPGEEEQAAGGDPEPPHSETTTTPELEGGSECCEIPDNSVGSEGEELEKE